MGANTSKLLPVNKDYQRRVKQAIEGTGEATVTEGLEIIGNAGTARAEASRIAQADVDVVVFNYAVWCFPHLSAIAAGLIPRPALLFSNLNPREPGMVGMLASAGTMDQVGHLHQRVWGDIAESAVLKRVMTFIRGAAAVSMLKGLTFGTFGGRPLGMYTATANVDQWQREFGIDIESNEQSDIVTYAKEVPAAQVSGARKWLEEKVGWILYDGKALTPEKLQLAIRSYLALKQLIKERHFDFIGVKAQPELTESFVTMDLAEAFLNDPYDWDGAHEPVVTSTESDMDGGLTMQLFKNVTRGQPVLFADVRHYDESRKLWYFSNSGMHPTFFAGASMHPEENLKNVTFYPEISDFPAGGPSVHHFAAPGKVTLARLARRKGKYWMALLRGDFVEIERRQALELGKTITPEWPIAFTRLGCTAEEFLSNFPCNHIHGVYGDFTREMIAVGKVMGIETRLFGAGQNPSFAEMGEDSNEE